MLSSEMKLLFVLLVSYLVIRTSCTLEASSWKQYKKLYGKDYKEQVDGGKEDHFRKMIFQQTDARIRKHNSGNFSFQLGHNEFSDMTNKELVMRLGTTLPPNPQLRLSMTVPLKPHASPRALPSSLDYRESSCLPPVKSQGSCGSCWAFSAIAPLEFDSCRKSKSRSLLSEQQLVDCDTINHGCRSGWYTTAWSHLQSVNGSAKEILYPYVGSRGTCKFCPECESMVGAKVSSYGYIQSNNAIAMQHALQEYGPLAVAMTIVGSFFNYKSGVYNDVACDDLFVNHGVVIVGYGTSNGKEYWIARNSWGASWGTNGYVLIERGVDKCSIEKYAAFVVAAA